MRKAFNFYKSYYDVYKQLKTSKDKQAFIDALLLRQFEGVEPDNLEGMAQFAYISQKEVIDQQIKGWETKTGLKLSTPTEGGSATPTVQVQEKEEVQEEEKEKYPFDTFWSLYDKKVDRDKCLKKWDKLNESDKEKIIEHIPKYKQAQPEKLYRKNPATYLNNNSWNDEIINNDNNGQHKKTSSGNTAATSFNNETEKYDY